MPVALSAHRPAARTPAWPAGRRCSPISGSGTAADSRVVTPPRVRAEAGARRRTDFSSQDRPGACPNAPSPVLPGLGSWGSLWKAVSLDSAATAAVLLDERVIGFIAGQITPTWSDPPVQSWGLGSI